MFGKLESLCAQKMHREERGREEKNEKDNCVLILSFKAAWPEENPDIVISPTATKTMLLKRLNLSHDIVFPNMQIYNKKNTVTETC